MTFYILIKFTTIGFLILTMLLLLGILFFGDKLGSVYRLPMITLICFTVSSFVFFPMQANYQKKAVVDSLHLKNEDAIESIHSIGSHNKSFYEVKISDGFYHVTFESGALVPTVSKVEKVNEKK